MNRLCRLKCFLHCSPFQPTVSFGNVGQLAADLVISTLWMERVGYIYHESIIPVVGNNPFAHVDATSCKLTTCCEGITPDSDWICP